MDSSSITKQANIAFQGAFDHLSGELSRMRTGRAHASMLDSVMVEAYGSQMPLNQVGTVTAPEPQLLQITPYDPSNLQAISAAIRNNQSLGFNPSDDGRIVRVLIPPLTEERRREIAKQIGEKVEESLIRMRNSRHEAIRQLESAKKEKLISEDEARRSEKTIDESLNRFRDQMDLAAKAKQEEVLTI